MGSILGNRVTRVEDPRFLTRGGEYVDAIHFPNEAHCTYVRSPYAHATIESIDVSDALEVPGVLRIFTATDLDVLHPTPPSRPNLPAAMNRPFLAADRVRFVGEPIVAVVAETLAAAVDAAELVVVDYETLPVVLDVERSAADEELIFPAAGTNKVLELATPTRADFSECEVIVAERIVNQRLSGAPMEARAGVAYWTSEGRLVHYSSCQGAHVTRAMLCAVYGLEPAAVRVIVPDVGGGFGVKSRTYPEEAVLGFYARELGRPVRWSESRSENFLSMPQGRGQVQYAWIGGTRDGRITAYQLDVVQDAGAYPLTGSVLHMMTMRMTCGVYDIANVGFTGVSAVTNAPSITAYRGAGRPEAAVAIERMVDRFAVEIGMDPADVRRRNMIPAFTEATTTGVGTVYDVGDYPRSLEIAVKTADYDELRAEQARRRAAGDQVQLGIGIASYVEITSGVGGPEFGAVELQPDGRLLVRTGTTPYGQGHVTTWSMIVSDRTGVPIERITVLHGDTDEIRSGGLTVGSRSVQLGGTAIAIASTKLIDLARERAAQLLEAADADVVLDSEAGLFHVAGTPVRSVTWADLAASDGGPLGADHDFEAPMPTFPFGTHIAVVEVDVETGGTRLVRVIACDDAGTIMNPLLAEGQIHGGIAQGAAQALMEEVVYDADGTPKTSNFADYPVISAAELPSFELAGMTTPTWVNELGAKGVGESGTIGSIPSVYNAIVDAVSHLGVRHLEMPCTPEKVWAAIRSGALMTAMLVTGASRGIGAATAVAAVAAGWDVAVNYRSERERAESLAIELGAESGRRVVAVPGDVSVEADVMTMFDAVEAALGPIACLVNNAGIAPGYGAFVDLELADIERVWAVNLTGAFLCAREAVRRMAVSRGGQGGSIVNVSSKAAVLGGQGEWIHYAASKGGLETLTAGLSKEVAADGIRVNNVRPGLIAGEFGPWAPSGRVERMSPGIPMQRAGELSEIAAAIVWLASEAASYVTGATIDVTGGR